MATRQTKTPGATAPVEEEVKTTAELADKALDEILGTPETKDQSTKGTSTASELVDTEILKTILDNQKRIEHKIDSLLNAGGIEQPKKKRWVQENKGLVLREID